MQTRPAFEAKELAIPAGVKRKLVVGEAVSLDLRVRPPARHHRRHVGNAQLLRREDSSMPRNQCALFVDEHRDGPAPFADRGSDLGYLLLGMSASIAGIGDEFCERPALNLVRRPLGLARVHYARARARPQKWGS